MDTRFNIQFLVYNGSHFAAANSSIIPTPLPHHVSFDADNNELPDAVTFRRLEYRHDRDFYLAFVPEAPNFSFSPLLHALSYSKGCFPLENFRGTYRLSTDIRDKWRSLESLLFSAVSLLQGRFYPSQPVYLTVYWPSLYGYQKSSADFARAQRVSWRSREAFLSVFAYIDFLKCCARSEPGWDLYLVDKGMPMSFVELLNLWPSSYNSKRIGAFVHPYRMDSWTPQWLSNDLLRVMDSGVPLWFPFGDLTSTTAKMLPLPSSLLPTLTRLHSALPFHPSQPTLPPSDLQKDWKIQRLYLLREKGKYPEPIPRSGQLYGESSLQFLQRRSELHKEMEMRETPSAKSARQQRKLEYDGPSGQRMPSTRSSAKIFYWELVDPVSGYRSRTRIDKAQWESYWENRNGQRVYDEVFNEWDICSEFGDSANRWEYSDDEDDEFEGVTWLGERADGPSGHGGGRGRLAADSYSTPCLHAGSNTNDPPTSMLEDFPSQDSVITPEGALNVLVTSSCTPESNRSMEVVDSIDDLLLFRYGLHPQSFTTDVGNLKIVPPANALASLALTRANVDNTLLPLLQRFVTTPQRQPSSVDLQLASSQPLKLKILADSYSPRVFDVFGVFQGRCLIIEQKEPNDHPWKLVVDDPVAVMQIIRRGWGPDIPAIAANLLQRGIPFHTFRLRPFDMVYNDAHHHEYIRWRDVSLGHHFGSLGLAADYNSYVILRNRFLQEPYAARAALLRGGIVWRLAMDALGYEYALEEVLKGPSVTCIDFGGIPQYLSDDTEMWDDALSDAELDLICGVYKQCTGTPQDLSWWPKGSLWKGSGLDVGYWSVDCETWYTHRRAAILANDTKVGKLRNATQWRNALKFARKRTKTVQEATAAFSDSLLSALQGY